MVNRRTAIAWMFILSAECGAQQAVAE